jgi:hypothetical protein
LKALAAALTLTGVCCVDAAAAAALLHDRIKGNLKERMLFDIIIIWSFDVAKQLGSVCYLGCEQVFD